MRDRLDRECALGDQPIDSGSDGRQVQAVGLQQLDRGVVTRTGGIRLAKELVLFEEADQQVLGPR